MRKTYLKKLGGITLVMAILMSTAACGFGFASDPDPRGRAVSVTTESAEEASADNLQQTSSDSTQQESGDSSQQTAGEYTSIRDVQAETVTPDISKRESVEREYEGAISGVYPDADYIEHIAEGRFVVLYHDREKNMINGIVYDIANDVELNTFSLNDLDDYDVAPEVFDGQGFGFIFESKGKNAQLFGYYYDIDGNEVSTFKKDVKDATTWSYSLAPDGSAMYVEMNDREQCACGFDFKADYTTQIYAVYGDGSEELIKEYDSHTNIGILGTTSDNKIVLCYNYDPKDKEVLTHEEYEQQWSLESDSDIERGYAFLEPKKDAELDKFYVTSKYYDYNEIFIRGNKINFIADDEIIHFYPDESGVYQGVRYTTEMGLDGIMTYNYVSVNGDYIVYPVYSEDSMNTKVLVLHFNGDKPEILCEEQCDGMYVEFMQGYKLAGYDEETGDFFGVYYETKEDGLINQPYWGNIYGVE